MNNLVRKVWLASAVLLLCASGSCYVGEWQYRKDVEQLERWSEARGLCYMSTHVYPDTNVWEILGFSLFCAGISVALAAGILRRHEID
jgi:hypothetical protein